MVNILLMLVLFALVILAVTKKMNASSTLYFIGIFSILIYVVVSKATLAETGNALLDVFELAKSKIASQMSGTGLIIMTVMGYVKYMESINASKLLALYASRPLKKLGKPYLIVALGMVIGAIIKLCVPSHAGLATLLMATMYPIFLACGVPNLTAAAAIGIAGAFDLGPACPVTTWAVSQEPVAALTTVAEFFVKYQLLATAIIVTVAIIVFVLVSRKADKSLAEDTKEIEEIDPKSLNTPSFFCLLPLLPLVIVIIFSGLFKIGAKISVVGGYLLGFVLATVIALIFKKGSFVSKFNETKQFWQGMGTAFANVASIVCAAAVFSAALGYTNGAAKLMEIVGGSSAGGVIVVILAGVINFLVAFMTGSGVASSYTILPMMYGVVEATGSNLLAVVLVIVCTGGLGRAVSPVCGGMLMVAGASDIDIITIVKRTTVPILCALVTALIIGVVML